MIFDFKVDDEKKNQAIDRVKDFASGMEKAFRNSFEESVFETGRRSQREIRTLVNLSRADDGYIQAIPGLSQRYLESTANLKLLDRSVPLRAFKARQTPEGVEVELTRAGISKKVYRGAFGPKIAKLGGDVYRRAGRKRFPIIKIADLKVTEIEGVPATFQTQVQRYREVMIKRLEKAKAELKTKYGVNYVAT